MGEYIEGEILNILSPGDKIKIPKNGLKPYWRNSEWIYSNSSINRFKQRHDKPINAPISARMPINKPRSNHRYNPQKRIKMHRLLLQQCNKAGTHPTQ